MSTYITAGPGFSFHIPVPIAKKSTRSETDAGKAKQDRSFSLLWPGIATDSATCTLESVRARPTDEQKTIR